MGFVDLIWLSAILAGSGWLIYRSLWKKKGHCQSGCGGQCDGKEKR